MEYLIVWVIGFTIGSVIFLYFWMAERNRRIKAESFIKKLQGDLKKLEKWK